MGRKNATHHSHKTLVHVLHRIYVSIYRRTMQILWGWLKAKREENMICTTNNRKNADEYTSRTYVPFKCRFFYASTHTYSLWSVKCNVFVFILRGVCSPFLFVIWSENKMENPLQICRKQNVRINCSAPPDCVCLCACVQFSHNPNVGRTKMNVIQMWYFNTVLSLLTPIAFQLIPSLSIVSIACIQWEFKWTKSSAKSSDFVE